MLDKLDAIMYNKSNILKGGIFNMDLSHCRQKLSAIIAEEARLLRVFSGREALMKGSIYRTRTKCGNKNCKCSKGELHIVWRITKSEEGKTRTKSLCRNEEIEKYKKLTENYREFREARAQIVEIHKEQIKLINQIEKGRRVEYGLKFGR